jgi:ribonuclease HI
VVPDGAYAAGFDPDTTNQRMEVSAVLEALRAFEGPVLIVSDSTYVVHCFRDHWWRNWIRRGWKNKNRQPIANRDLWEPLIELYQGRDNVAFRWVKGHSGDRWNDEADRLAVAAIERRSGLSG